MPGKYGEFDLFTKHRYTLKLEPNWFWEFKHLGAGEMLQLQKDIRSLTPEGEMPDAMVIAVNELAYTYSGCNIPFDYDSEIVAGTIVEDKPKPPAIVGTSIDAVRKFLESMPVQFVTELWEELYAFDPNLGGRPRMSPEEIEQKSSKSSSETLSSQEPAQGQS